ncbi:general transcription factor 3C polypeptide 1 [Schistocerca americana]|uniref:general transcription factor 3C polypeptide 1 n=1 Tax=Schistocerca americana TaxID=7009 RepID=UPI001F4F8CDB|nr:general transcription factor 3C polypeptide 1 [Schistocerca americana]XP_049949394.1 general transcription factor 3C polypeptide 1 [Schistocerca serialis cubense]
MGDDLVTCLIDEICLEGLDGITLDDLWLRLKERPGFDLILDDSSKEFLWKLIKELDDVEFYELHKPRNPLIIFDRYKYVDPELGTVLEPDEIPEDIYPFHQIDDIKNGVMGSCSTYHSRRQLKEDLASLSYTDIISRYGRKFVVVGSQSARNAALMGDETDPGVELSLMHYCLLERIGRSRYHGEITQGKISLQVVGEDPKSLFYHRKFLTANNFITKQVHHLKTGAQNCSGSLLHLPRFYVERKPKALYLTEKVIEILKTRTNYIAEYDEIRQELRLSNSLKKLFKTFDFQKFVRTDQRIPYRALHPDAKPSEWKLKNNDKEKTIRVIQLIDPDMNVQDLWAKDDEFEEPEDGNTVSPGNVDQVLDRPLLSQAYYAVEAAGPQGVSQLELAAIMGMSKLQSRTVCRNLLRTGLIVTFMNDIGRQRVSRFMAKIFERQCEMNLQFNREKERMLALTSEGGDKSNAETVRNFESMRKRKCKTFEVTPQSKRQKKSRVKQEPVKDTDRNIQISVAKKNEVPVPNFGIPSSLESPVQAPSSFSKESSDMASSDTPQTTQEISCHSVNSNSSVNCTEQNTSLELQLSSLPTSQEGTVSSEKLDCTEETQNLISGCTLPHTSTSSPAPGSPLCTGQTFPSESSVSFLTSELTPSKEDNTVVTRKTVSDNGIVTEITESTAVRHLPRGFDENLEDLKSYFAHQVKDTTCVTYRLLKRANLIIESIKSQKVIEDLTKLMKLISEEEDREGYNVRIDKKSLMRLLSKLSNDGFLKVIKVVLKGGDKEKVLHFVCEPSVTVDHSVIQSAIEQTRVKSLITAKEKSPKAPTKTETNKENKDLCKECTTVNQSVNELNSINVGVKEQKLIYDKRIGKKYGFSPKFIRMKTLHQFLFYLVAGYEGVLDLDQVTAISDLKEQGTIITEEDESNMPKIFVPKPCWKMFIPPLPQHTGWPKGWALMCDILLRLPLSIFVKVFNVSYIVPDMENYLTHSVRRHYLVKHLPENMRCCLFSKRKYIFSIHEVMQRLCFVGLVRFGPQRLKEKDQVFVYLNRRTHLLDTTTSKPGYHQVSDNIVYQEHKYYFGEMADVEKYWYDMWNICLHTNLGGRLCVAGKDIVLEMLHNKPAMVKSLEPVTPQEIELLDVGDVPGDRRGAGGLDSALFSHLKRNWNWSYTSKFAAFDLAGTMSQNTEVKKQSTASISEEIKKNKEIFDSYVGNTKKGNRLQRSISRKPAVAVAGAPALKPTTAPRRKAKAKKITRRVLIRQKKKEHRPYYDEADQAALLLMSKLRVDWSHTEDNFLLLCKVASMYLCPVPRQQLVPFQLIRDILHSKFPESHNKTSRACQRRILYMMKNMSTSSSVALFLEEIRQDAEIKKKFEISVSELRKKCENSEEVERIVAEKFRGLIVVLEKRFDRLANKKASMVIPDTPELFWKKYEIIRPSKSLKKRGFFQDVKCITDIQKAVIQSVIHSSLCCVQDKTSWAYQLFKVYQQFPDNLLRSAMKKIREDQIVSLKKNYMHLAQRKGNFLPLSCSPFQLSISYRHILQTSYQYSIFHQSFTMSLSLENWHASNDWESNPEDRGLKLMVTDGGSTAALVELFCKGVIEFDLEIPDQIITLNPKVSEVDEGYARIIERYKEILRSYKPGTEFFSSSALFKNYGSSTGANSDESDEEEDKNDPDYSPTDDPSTCNATSLARTASRIALYMMREELEDKMVENNQHAHDFFVVNSCTVYCKINKLSGDKTNQEIKGYIKTIYPLEKEKIKSTLDDLSSRICVESDKIDEEDLRTSFINSGHSDSDWAKMLKIISYLASKRELGARLKQFKLVCQRNFKELQFSEIVSFLTQNGVVIRNGVTEARYIHWKFIKLWLVNTRRLRRLSREKLKPSMAKGLRVVGPKKEVVTEGERKIKKKKGQMLYQLKKRKAECNGQQQKRKQKLRKVQSQSGKTKSSVIKRNRYRFSLKTKSHLRAELKARIKSSSSGVNVNSDAEQAAVVPEDSKKTNNSCYNQKDDTTTDSTDANIPLSEAISDNNYPQHPVEVNNVKTNPDSVDSCSLHKKNDVNTLEDPQITDDGVTSPKKTEEHKSVTVSNTEGTTATSLPHSSNLDSCGSSNNRCHLPESSVVSEKGKTCKIPNKKSTEVKQENVEVQRPRKRKRNEISRKQKIEMDKSAKVMELKAAARELENSEQIQISMRPWIRINGTLNRRILDRLLGAILGHCMSKPGNTIESIAERFSPAIQPFHVRELLEILWKIGCVKMYTIHKSWPATLFSSPSNITILPADGSESSADIVVDPQPDAVTRLGQFIGKKTYSKDFLSC